MPRPTHFGGNHFPDDDDPSPVEHTEPSNSLADKSSKSAFELGRSAPRGKIS